MEANKANIYITKFKPVRHINSLKKEMNDWLAAVIARFEKLDISILKETAEVWTVKFLVCI